MLHSDIIIQIGRPANKPANPRRNLQGLRLSGLLWSVVVVGVSLQPALLDGNRCVGCDWDVPSKILIFEGFNT